MTDSTSENPVLDAVEDMIPNIPSEKPTGLNFTPDNPLLDEYRTHYLNALGEIDSKNLEVIIQGLVRRMGVNPKVKWAIYAVGGTVREPDPKERKDIDIRVEIDTEELFGQGHVTPYEKSRDKFDAWQNYLSPMISALPTESITPHKPFPDHEHENLSGIDGKITLTFEEKSGRPIELMCAQKNTVVKKPFVWLGGNKEVPIPPAK